MSVAMLRSVIDHGRRRSTAVLPARVAFIAALVLGSVVPAHAAPVLPEIRTSQSNPVPSCVTPDRLMAFLKQRNGHLDPRFRNIASYYKQHGETWGVRWDYAFFQMAIETNFLTYRQPNGRMGDVDPKQNNFAGIGTTGGGVPGDSFPDVSTGVLGQIQHLVVYSGEMVPRPVAQRTQLKQEHILAGSRVLKRPVRFSDLAGRWAADRKYGGSIEWVAERFRAESCKGRAPVQESEALPWQQPAGKAATRVAAAPSASSKGKGKAPAKADVSPSVRTVWSKDQKRVEPKVAASPAKAVEAKPVTVQDVPVPPVQQTTASEPQAAEQPVAPEEPGAHFALFTPPAELAGATIPDGARAMASSDAGNSEVIGPPKPDTSARKDDPSVAPVAVAGSSVGGFMIGGPAKPDFQPPAGLGVKPGRCVVETARYGGETTVLLKSPEGADVHYIALSVLDGFEDSMTKSFLSSRSGGGEVLGTYPSRDEAVAKARTLCPD